MADDDLREREPEDHELLDPVQQLLPDPPPPAPRPPRQPIPECSIEEFLDQFSLVYQELRGPEVPCQELTRDALIMHEPTLPVGPLRSIEYAHALLGRGPYSLLDVLRWQGDDCSGVVSLYCCGDVPLYQPIRDRSSRLPLVVGSDLRCLQRLKGFAASLQQVGLGLDSFTCRMLPLPETQKEDARKALDALYVPIWSVVDGFLAKQFLPDSRGVDSMRSRWDTLHRGRVGAGQRERGEDLAAQLEAEIPNTLIRYRQVERRLAAFLFLTEETP